MRLRIPQEREKIHRRPRWKGQRGNPRSQPIKSAPKDVASAKPIPADNEPGFLTMLQAHLGNAWVQRVVEKARARGMTALLKVAPSPAQIQLQGEEVEEPPKGVDPKSTLEVILNEWPKTEEGRKIIAQLKGVGAKREKPEEKLLLGAASILAATMANKMKVPQKAFDLIPEIELGEDVKLKIKPIWKGTLGKPPKEWGGIVTLTIKW